MKTADIDQEMERIFEKFPVRERSALIPILQAVQDVKGYISEDAIRKVSMHLNLPSSKIYGVATFYNQFRLNPPGRHLIQLCRGTACHVKGSAGLLDAVQRELGIKPGQTSKDRRFTLETVACIGACSIAPVICIDGNYHGKVTEKDLPEIFEQYK